MPFTQENKPLLEAAATIAFQFRKDGSINSARHTKYELGLFFIKKAIEVHGNKYGYSKVEYINKSTKVILQCEKHGLFEQIPNNHIRVGGCSKCGGSTKLTTEEFIKKAKVIHGNKYDYSSVQYKSSHEKIEIVCLKHGSFFQAPTDHLSLKGCPKCAGHNHNILYLLKCLETGWYKIGITTDNVQKRIASIGGNIEEIYHVKLEDPKRYESILHKRYAKDREYNLCVRGGHTEFFSLTEEQAQEIINYMNEIKNG